MFGFEIDSRWTMPAIRFTSLERQLGLILHALRLNAMEANVLHATLFLAANTHMVQHGRPTIGDTWLRSPTKYGIMGVILGAVLADAMQKQSALISASGPELTLSLTATGVETANAFKRKISLSDMEAVETAYASVMNAGSDDAIRALVTGAQL